MVMLNKYFNNELEGAAMQYADENSIYIDDGTMGDAYVMEKLSDAYKAGAKYAINEFLKDLWHSTNEEPEINKEILVDWRTENRSIMFLQTKLNNWKKLSNQEIKRWLYIDDLLLK